MPIGRARKRISLSRLSDSGKIPALKNPIPHRILIRHYGKCAQANPGRSTLPHRIRIRH